MPMKGANRFALLANKGSDKPSASNSSDWPTLQDSKKNSTSKATNQTSKITFSGQPRTLVIRDKNWPSVAAKKPLRSVSPPDASSGSSSSSDGRPRQFPDFWCGVCQHAFKDKGSIVAHTKNSLGHDNYCNLCTRVFKDRNGLQNHVDNSVGHEIRCNICLSAFKDKNGLKNHFENVYTGHPFACLTCLQGFGSRKQLDQHLNKGKNHVWCTTCHRQFLDQKTRDEHWANTSRHRHCLQPGCQFDAPDQANLENHLSEMHARCDICAEVFPSQSKLRDHAYKCFKCPHCSFHTNSHAKLMEHSNAHAEPSLQCWACRLPILSNSSLVHHLESGACHDFQNPYLLLKLLGTWWYSVLYMDIDLHIQIRTGRVAPSELLTWVKEGAVQPYICRADRCGVAFNSFSSLVSHVESTACDWNVGKLRLDWLKNLFEDEYGERIEKVRTDRAKMLLDLVREAMESSDSDDAEGNVALAASK